MNNNEMCLCLALTAVFLLIVLAYKYQNKSCMSCCGSSAMTTAPCCAGGKKSSDPSLWNIFGQPGYFIKGIAAGIYNTTAQ